MATIIATSMGGTGSRTITQTTLTGTADTFIYNASAEQLLILFNDTGGSLSPVIDGSGATSIVVAGIGSVNLSGGYPVGTIAAGAMTAVPLDTIKEFLKGTIAITGATGIVASLLSF